MKPTGRYCLCFFHLHDPKPKRNHQIASSRVKTNQDEMRHVWGIWIISFGLGEIQMWTQVIWKKFTKKRQMSLIFQTLSSISPKCHLVCFNQMLDCRAMTVTIYLAPWYEDHSLSVECYDFCLHAILFL